MGISKVVMLENVYFSFYQHTKEKGTYVVYIYKILNNKLIPIDSFECEDMERGEMKGLVSKHLISDHNIICKHIINI